jgi:hypothetical protein
MSDLAARHDKSIQVKKLGLSVRFVANSDRPLERYISFFRPALRKAVAVEHTFDKLAVVQLEPDPWQFSLRAGTESVNPDTALWPELGRLS